MTGGVGLPLGVERLPADWTTAKLKHIAQVESSNVDKKSHDDEMPVRLCNYTDVYYNDRITRALSFMEATATPREIARFSLHRGDILLTKDSEHWSDIAVPALVVDDLDGVLCGYHLAHVRPNASEVDSGFLFYCFVAEPVNRQLQVVANGVTRFGLPIGELRGAVIPIPPVADQRLIADFLDEKTAAIDALIAKKERLIDLIEEKRQAAITRAVTKGLDPDVPMKDSGVEWFGKVPNHWQIFRLKQLAREPFQYGANEAGLSDDPTSPRFIRITDLRADGGLRDDTFKSLPEDVARPYLLSHGDILFARSGATVGKAVRYRAEWGRACFAGYLIRYRPNERIVSSAFIEYYTQCAPYREEVGASTIQATIQNVSAQKFGEFRIAVPPLDEQLAVVAELDLITQQTRDVVRSLEIHIEKLREYRQAIISAAVTGQIDVRSRSTRANRVLEEALA